MRERRPQPRALIHLPSPLVLLTTRFIGVVVHDVVLTRDEIRELTESLLVSPRRQPTTPDEVQRLGRRERDLDRPALVIRARAQLPLSGEEPARRGP